uniref:Uncharacterized protein n=1 Tax=Hyaloperonospora arabidopsidis (strain Emoy2) TaxID=559515 RepID=M4BXW9_HYAAE
MVSPQARIFLPSQSTLTRTKIFLHLTTIRSIPEFRKQCGGQYLKHVMIIVVF